jgi:cytochrome c-type biogenesis protein CcmH/NrfG
VDAALETSPRYPDLHKVRGDIMVRKGDITAARAAYTRAADINPDYAEAVFGLVVTLRREGKGRAADEELRRFITHHPADAMARILLTVDRISVAEG